MRRSLLALLTLTGCGLLTTFDPPGVETPAQCSDGMDNDGDGAADCADSDCTNVPACPSAEDCGNSRDDDQDGFTDCLDPDCAASPECAPVEDCDNNLDDDADGDTDCDDSDCAKSVDCIVQGPLAVDDDAADLPELNGVEDEALRFPAALLLANDQDPDGGALEFVGFDSFSSGITLTGSGDELEITPLPDFSGAASFTYTIRNASGLEDSATVSLVFAPVNDEPLALPLDLSTNEDEAASVSLSATDADGDTLAFVVSAEPAHGSLSGTAPDLVYTPEANFFGDDEFRYVANDAEGPSAEVAVTIIVLPVNDAPVAVDDDGLSTGQGQSFTFPAAALVANDSDVDNLPGELQVVAVGSTANAQVLFDGVEITVIPTPGFQGLAPFSYTLSDGVLTDDGVVNFVVSANQNPSAQDDGVFSGIEDTDLVISVADLLANDSDPEGHALSIVEVFDAVNVSASLLPSGDVLVTPIPDFFGAASLGYRLVDSEGGVAFALVLFDFAPVADAPVADPLSLDVNEDESVAFSLTGSDADGDSISFALVDAPLHGTLSGDLPDLVYTPDAEFFGVDEFRYTVSDGALLSEVATVTINVISVNDLPNAADDAASTAQGSGITIDVLANDSGLGDGGISVVILSQGQNGSALVNDDLSVSYQPDETFDGIDTLVYQVSDADGDSDTAEIVIAVGASCGDGLLGSQEGCDDGNNSNGDGCNAACVVEFCGDGIVNNDLGKGGSEQCDDGNTLSGDGCDATCGLEVCGDGIINNAGLEACDDGNIDSGDGCDATCTIELGSACTGAPSVCEIVCGDGLVIGAESCDDGNTSNSDGCNNVCQTETGFACNGSPSVCEEVCGDGLIVGSEQCDDFNALGGDGCNALCNVETGFDCNGSPSLCAEVCGDGLVVGGESCDDANLGNGDGCSAVCQTETGFDCNGSPSVCATICGDGFVRGAEGCDDGNLSNGDGCNSFCVVEFCGDNVVNNNGEQCDDGNLSNGDGCNATCVIERCGDGSINNNGTEQCDDGNTTSGDGCNATCVIERCGDGITNNAGLEQCDDGNLNNNDSCKNNCSLNVCGDGILLAGIEFCDDGNLSNGDGCNSFCVVERCGDGAVNNNGTEQCDDGNANNNDSCKNNCTNNVCGDNALFTGVEFCDDGNLSNGDGCNSFCVVERCGDGAINNNGTEQCDDGNLSNGDGCTAVCVIERCGDGLVNNAGAEQCDDGNTTNGDGCNAACVLERCGDGITNNAGLEQCDDGNFNNNDSCKNNCSLNVCGDGTLFTGVEFCDDGNKNNGDGCNAACVIERCGDGVINNSGTEQCDDGNLSNGDGCTAVCVIERCGDGVINNSGSEQCDDGNFNNNDSCKNNCTNAVCGDGVIRTGFEVCDDGNLTGGDGCRSDCAGIELCGDGLFDFAAGEECDDANADRNDGCDDICRVEFCGDGVIQGGLGESCDDGNNNNNDKCDANCNIECGNGVVNVGEQCDDGNNTIDDGCDGRCVIERCGDGILQPGLGEACDDGNLINGDGCGVTCQTEGNCAHSFCVEGGPLTNGCNACVSQICSIDPFCCSGGWDNICVGEVTSICEISCTGPGCGNGDLQTIPEGEVCDDGNTLAGDDCRADCEGVELCGDGRVDFFSGEDCDDGNLVDGDGCSSSCTQEVLFADLPPRLVSSTLSCSLGSANAGRKIAVDGVGNLYAAMNCGGTIFVSVSRDHGLSFGAPISTGVTGATEFAIEGGPTGVAYLAAIGGNTLVFLRTLDAGLTWVQTSGLNNVISARGLSVDASNNEVYFAAAATINDGFSIFDVIVVLRSADFGATFPTVTNSRQSSTFLDVVVDKLNGDVFSFSQDNLLRVRRSTDNAKTFGIETRPPGISTFSDWASGNGTIYIVGTGSDSGDIEAVPVSNANTVIDINGLPTVSTNGSRSIDADALGNVYVSSQLDNGQVQLDHLRNGSGVILGADRRNFGPGTVPGTTGLPTNNGAAVIFSRGTQVFVAVEVY